MEFVKLQVREGDDPDFLQLVSILVSGECSLNSAEDAYLTRIDNWFSKRWLGFRGKALGIVGVRQRRYRGSPSPSFAGMPVIPPFHPNRVLSQEVQSLKDGTVALSTSDQKGHREDFGLFTLREKVT